MSQFIYQYKQAASSLKKKPGFVSTVVTTMGITLGALLCILTLAYVLIAKPLPYPDQEHLYLVESSFLDTKKEDIGKAFTYPGLIHLYQNQTVFEKSALVYYGEDVLTSHPSQPSLSTAFVTPEWFTLFGATMALGRVFEQTEVLNSNNPVAILTFQTWQTEFAANPDILGQKVNFAGISYQIVGVLKSTFIEPQIYQTGRKSQIYLPWDFNEADEYHRTSWGNISDNQKFIGKLSTQLSITQIEQLLTPLMNDTWQEKVAGEDFFNGWSLGTAISPLKSVIIGDNQSTVYMLLAGVIGLVLIACANISNLFMSRTAEQQRQLAIHAAVGASKKHLFKSLFAESGLLMGLAILLALIIALAGFFVLQHFLAERLPRVDELTLNSFTLASAIAIAVLLAFFFAKLSSNMINYRLLNATLQTSGKGAGIQVSLRIRKLLIISQVAIVTALVFVNIGLFKGALNTIDAQIGFDSNNITTLLIASATSTPATKEERIAIMTELKAKLIQLPQVEALSQSPSPLSGFGINAQVVVATNEHLVVETKYVDNNYFTLINQPLVEGDYFSAADIKDEVDLLIVNQAYARHLAGDASPIGMQINFGEPGDPASKVIGVVKAITIPGSLEAPMRAYRSTNRSNTRLMLKLNADQNVTREQATALIQGVTSQYSLFQLTALNDRREQLLFTQYITAITSAVLALLTFFLAAIGLYGILSYSTQMRRFEIGTRLALGAKRYDLIMMIIKDNTMPLIYGVATSIVLLLALYIGFAEQLENYIKLQLVGIFVLTLCLISTIAWFACYWPLRQFINCPAIFSLRGSD